MNISLRLATISLLSAPAIAHAAIDFGHVQVLSQPGSPYFASVHVSGASPALSVTNAPYLAYHNLGLPSRWSQEFILKYVPKHHKVFVSSDAPLKHQAVVIFDLNAHGRQTFVECPLPGQIVPPGVGVVRSSPISDAVVHTASSAPTPAQMPAPTPVVSTPITAPASSPLSASPSSRSTRVRGSAKQALTRLRQVMPVSSASSESSSKHASTSWEDSPDFHIGKGRIVAVMQGTGDQRHWQKLPRHVSRSSHWVAHHATTKLPVHSESAIALHAHISAPSSFHPQITSLPPAHNRPFLHGYGVPYLSGGWAFVGHVGPIQPGQTLSSIAKRINATNRFTVFQVMVAIYKANPSAFIGHDINLLRVGAVLKIQPYSAVEKLTVGQALMWIKLHSTLRGS